MYRSTLFVSLFALLFVGQAYAAVPQGPISPRGFISAHDPSTMIQCKDKYYIFSTGQGILSKSSKDQVFWSAGPPIFNTPPAWTTTAVPGFSGTFWAPDILFFNNKYYLYYAVSTFGSQVSAIGLATNPTLDSSDPAYHWTDQGIVIQSTNGSPYNTIDPSFTRDNAGNLWMAFGSYWSGIYLVQLDPATGLRIATNSPTYQLAYNGSIEASCIYRRGGYYYLFVNWGSCCSGVNSTYNIRVGRSTSITGPYVDKRGTNMASGGGTLFMQGSGKYAGPGHVGIISDGSDQWFTYHYYDGNDWAPEYGAYGHADFDFVPLRWTADDWPFFTNDWAAIYRFDSDAADDNAQYHGLLQNGATIQNDLTRGHVLNLNGTNQYVWLPPGVGYGKTFMAEVKWRGGPAWQRIFDFGFDTSKTVMLTPASGDNVLRCDINPGGNLQTLQWNQPLPSNVWMHVAVTMDGSRGVLYVNGSAVATNNSMNLLPVNVAPQTNHLGRSKFSVDPYFNGQIANFRVYGRALSAAEIVQPLPRITEPRTGTTWWPGQTISLSGTATDFADDVLAETNLSWQVKYAQDGMTNTLFGPTQGHAVYTIPDNFSGSGIFIAELTATDNSNRKSAASVILNAAHPTPSWTSYYPLHTDANDQFLHFNGALFGGATFVNDSERGAVLSLSGAGQYVQLPPGASGIQTFMAWVKWNGGAAWQRIFDFGNDTNHYTALIPSAANGKLRYNISLNSIPGEQVADGPAALPAGVWTHVAVVMNGTSALLYTNGLLAGSNSFANLVPGELGATNNYFGKSNWPDPYFNGRLSSIRLFSRPLADWEISAPQIAVTQPAPGTVYSPGQTINFAGFANDMYDSPINSTGLVWTVQFVNAGATNLVLGPVSGTTAGSFNIPSSGATATNGFYRVTLAATDSLGRTASNSATIFPEPTDKAWASFYAFDSAATDSSNRYNGALLGGATTSTDPLEGTVLNLSGSGQYVSFPPPVSSAQTFGAWVKWRGGGAWQRIFDFGIDTGHYFFLTPKDSSGLIQCAITPDAPKYNQIIQSTSAFPSNQWTHVAVSIDGRQGILYLNGKAVGVNNSMNLLPSDVGATKAFLGRSEFAADPYLNAQIDSLFFDSESESSFDIWQRFLQPTLKISSAASQTTLSWPTWAPMMQLASSSDFRTWATVTNIPFNSGSNLSVTLPGEAAKFFRLQWP